MPRAFVVLRLLISLVRRRVVPLDVSVVVPLNVSVVSPIIRRSLAFLLLLRMRVAQAEFSIGIIFSDEPRQLGQRISPVTSSLGRAGLFARP